MIVLSYINIILQYFVYFRSVWQFFIQRFILRNLYLKILEPVKTYFNYVYVNNQLIKCSLAINDTIANSMSCKIKEYCSEYFHIHI